jgi:hypothetical protein
MTNKKPEMKLAYVANNTAVTSIKNYIYNYTTPCETVIYDSDGMRGDHISHP